MDKNQVLGIDAGGRGLPRDSGRSSSSIGSVGNACALDGGSELEVIPTISGVHLYSCRHDFSLRVILSTCLGNSNCLGGGVSDGSSEGVGAIGVLSISGGRSYPVSCCSDRLQIGS